MPQEIKEALRKACEPDPRHPVGLAWSLKDVQTTQDMVISIKKYLAGDVTAGFIKSRDYITHPDICEVLWELAVKLRSHSRYDTDHHPS